MPVQVHNSNTKKDDEEDADLSNTRKTRYGTGHYAPATPLAWTDAWNLILNCLLATAADVARERQITTYTVSQKTWPTSGCSSSTLHRKLDNIWQ